MSDSRYDIVTSKDGTRPSAHYCREMGCFGTNPDHGYTWEEARNEMVQHYTMIAEQWKTAEEFGYWPR